MRLFVGVEVDDAVRREAERVMAALDARLRGIGVRWVPAENLHLTVRFVGHVPDDRSEALLAALDRPLALEPFEIEYGGAGKFPPRGAPRVLWLGVRRGLAPLSALHDEFNRRLAPFGYEPDARPFSAHLTLARIKDAPARAARDVDTAVSAHPVTPIAHAVDEVVVFESRSSPHGQRYTPLRRIRLGG